jgi:endonuclease/exonuclease/phosphatase family metal-dependent hydrolase
MRAAKVWTYIGMTANEEKPPFRVATWNIRAGLGTDLRRDAGRILAAIAALGADVVALQEADFRLGARPSALPREGIAAAGLQALPLGLNADSLGWHGNALLVRPGLRLTGLERLTLPGLEPRGAVIAELAGDQGPLRVVAAHLGLLRMSRRRQLDTIREAVSRRAPLPTVVLGDFNEHSRRVGLGRLARAFQLVPPVATFPSRRPALALDRMAHSPDLLLRPLPLLQARGAQPSDHLPLLAELRWIAPSDCPKNGQSPLPQAGAGGGGA